MSTPQIYEDHAAEYAALQAQAAPLLARMEEIKKVLRDLPVGSHQLAGLTVNIAANRQLDKTRLAEEYPPEQYPDLYKSQPDSAAVKKYLSPAVIETLSKYGDPRVTIK